MLVFGDSRIFFVCTNAKKVTETGQNPYSLVTQRRKKAEIKTFLIKKNSSVNFLKISTIDAPYQHLTLRFFSEV